MKNLSEWILVGVATAMFLLAIFSMGTRESNTLGRIDQHVDDIVVEEQRTQASLDALHVKVGEISERVARIEGYLEQQMQSAKRGSNGTSTAARVFPGKSLDQNMASMSKGDTYAGMTSQAFAAGFAQGYRVGHKDGHLEGWKSRDGQACSCSPSPEGTYCAMPGCDCDCGFRHSETEGDCEASLRLGPDEGVIVSVPQLGHTRSRSKRRSSCPHRGQVFISLPSALY